MVPIEPLVPMDYQFDESYPFVYIGHVWKWKKVLHTSTPDKDKREIIYQPSLDLSEAAELGEKGIPFNL